ncbi:hypothetical protein [Streptomyces olivaceoviridis]
MSQEVAEEARALLKVKVKEMEKAGERRRPCWWGTWSRAPPP